MLRPNTFALTALLALTTALGPLSVDMNLASLPAIEHAFAATTAEAQSTISVYLVGFALAQVVYGPVTDRYGRRPILLLAIGLFTLASAACAVAPSIVFLDTARFFQALGGAGGIVIARAIVRDLYAGARAGRELSLMGATMGLAPIIGPPIGGALQSAFDWRAAFILLVAVGVGITAVVWKLLPETLREPNPEPISLPSIVRGYGRFLRHGSYLAYVGIIACSYGGLFAWISGCAFVLQQVYHLTPLQFGIGFGISAAGYLLGTLAATHYVMHLGLGRIIGIGSALQAVGGLGMLLPVFVGLSSPITLLVGISLYLAGMGMNGPQAMAGALTPFPQHAGAASSLFGFVQQTWSAILGAAVGALLIFGEWPMSAAIAAMGLLALVIWAATRTTRRRPGKAAGAA
jgi:DHA1 family bicyclomycin/chloramphenicol resistance-like MFS transporter